MAPIHVIVQTKQEHCNEMYLRLRFFWWAICSFLFTLLFYGFIKTSFNLFLIFLGFLFLFAYADLTKNEKTKAHVHAFLGVLYFIWGILFLIVTLIMIKTNDEKMIGLIVTAIFFTIAYKKIKKYTNIIELLFKRRASGKSPKPPGKFGKPKRCIRCGRTIKKKYKFCFKCWKKIKNKG